MKKAIKYVLCILLSVALTSLVIFLPYFYYSIQDSSNHKAVAETFKLESTKTYLTPGEYVELIDSKSDSELIWVDSTSSVDTEYIVFKISSALENLRTYAKENKYLNSIINSFLETFSDLKMSKIKCSSVNGRLNNTPAMASLLYVEYLYPDIYTYDTDSFAIDYSYSILMDQNTNVIYEFNYNIYSGEETIFPEIKDDSEYINFYSLLHEEMFNTLMKYWENANEDRCYIELSPNYFSFNILPDKYIGYNNTIDEYTEY